jgi:hypothetical protein
MPQSSPASADQKRSDASEGIQGEQTLIDQIVQNSLARLDRLQHRRIEVLAHRGAQSLLLLAHGLLEIQLKRPCHRSQLATTACILDVGIDTPESERKRDQKQEDLNNLLLLRTASNMLILGC